MRYLIWAVLLTAPLTMLPRTAPITLAIDEVSSAPQDSLLVPAKKFPLAGVVIVLDPGHGGSDPGTKRKDSDGQVYTEDRFTLGMCIEMTNQIKDKGGTVVSTVLAPDSVVYVQFGQNKIPARGAEFFNLKSRPKIVAKAPGLTKRLEIAQLVLDQYSDKTVYWISIHFDHLGSAKSKSPVSGVRICFSSEAAETTFVQVTRLKKTRPKVHGKRVTQWAQVTEDSIASIRPSSFVRSLAEAFNEADLLRDPKDKPIISGSRGGFKRLFILSGKNDQNRVVTRLAKKRKFYNRIYNQILDPVLIEYAVLNNENDWQRLQQPEGSLKRLAEITVQGLIKHAQRDTSSSERSQ